MQKKLATRTNEVCEGYRNGLTIKQLSDIHGCSPGTVRNLLVACSVPLRSRGRRSNNKRTEV